MAAIYYRSIPLFSAREWALMSEVTTKTLQVSFFLLPFFFLLRITHDYTKSALGEERSALFKGLYEVIILLILLVGYAQLMEALDMLTYGIMRSLRHQNIFMRFLRALVDSILFPISTTINLFRKFFSFFDLVYVRAFLIYLRGYLIIFSTAVGPLTIAVSILPGSLSKTLATWLGVHITFLAWGITMTLLDLFIKASYKPFLLLWPISLVRDWFALQAFSAMYLTVIPLTSLYIGKSMSTGLITMMSIVMRRELKKGLSK